MIRDRKVGLTTNVNQTGATLTSVAVVISTTGVRVCSPNLRSREDVNCIQTVSVSDLIQQGGRAGRVAPGKHVIVASEEQVQRQFRGPSTPELLNADIAPLLSVCKKVGVAIEKFPALNAPSKVVIAATKQRMHMLDMIDDSGRLTPMGSSKLSFDFSPEWARKVHWKPQASSTGPSCRYGRALHRSARPWATQVCQWEGSDQGRINGMALC